MHNGIVDAHTSRLGVLDDVSGSLLACCKVIECQGCGVRVDVLYAIVDVVEGNDGEYGAKNLVGK